MYQDKQLEALALEARLEGLRNKPREKKWKFYPARQERLGSAAVLRRDLESTSCRLHLMAKPFESTFLH
jgi:hypothetical protein